MRMLPFEDARLDELMAWFPDRDACRIWGGPGFRFPFTPATFRADSKVGSLPSWSLVADDDSLAGFGQYYLRAGRCHLGRIVIAPALRGGGLGGQLVRELCSKGAADLAVDEFSLFVMPGNERALRLYQRLGFRSVPYPEPSAEFAAAVYMIATKPV